MALSLLDTNVLVHAAYRRSPLYAQAAQLVDRGLKERGRYCISPQNLVEFAAVVTRARLVEAPLPPDELRRIVETLYRSRRLHKIYPTRGSVIRTIRTGALLAIGGPAWYDLYLAITMRDAGVHTVVTENVADFQRFSFVKTIAIRDAV